MDGMGKELAGEGTGRLLHKVMSQMEDYVFVWNRRRQFVYVNGKLEKLWGLSREDYIGKTPEDIGFSPESAQLFHRQADQVTESRRPVEGRIPYTGPNDVSGIYEYILNPVLDDQGQVEFIAGVSRDVTERERAEAILEESERQFSLLFESIDQAFCLLECIYDDNALPVDFRILKANPAFKRHTGIQDPVGKTQRGTLPDLESKWIEAWCRVARTGEAERFVDYSPFLGRWFDTGIFPLEGQGSRRIALLFQDITEKKKVEQALTDADRRKDEFLATLAHELRNPLAAIRNGLEVVRLAPQDTRILAEAFETLDRQTRQLVTLVDDLMEVSRITRGKLELRKQLISLEDVIISSVEASRPLIQDAGHTLVLDLPTTPIRLEADPNRLAQVLSNLLNNASRYTPEKGEIRLSARLEDGTALVQVQDTGIGIPKEQQALIFEMFAQLERPPNRGYSGLGLGLTLSRLLVEKHGGSIEVHSEGRDRGSTFTVHLPAGRQDAVLPASPADAHHESVSGVRALVVDDNYDAARMLAKVIGMLGGEVKTAHNGREAIDTAERFQPEVIFMDLGMPEMDGCEAARRIRGESWGKDMVLVALSGWGQEEDKRKTREAGFDRHLVKPAEITDLQEVLEELVGRHRPGPSVSLRY